MGNIRSKRNFIDITKKISLSILIVMAHFSYTIQASQNVYTTANTLTQESYNTPEMQNAIILLMNNNLVDATQQNIPSVEEIIAYVCKLQNTQGIIKNKKTKTKALEALNAAIQATDKALLIANSQSENEVLECVITSTQHHELIDLLNNQKRLLQQKIAELNKETIWSYFSKPLTPYIAAGIAIALLTTGIGTAYYYGYFNSHDSSQPIIFTGAPLTKKREDAYEKIQYLLKKYHDPHDKDPLSNYMEPIKQLKNEFDPVIDKPIIKALDTVIEAEIRQEMLIKNIPFWLDIYIKQDDYINLFDEIARHNNSETTKTLNLKKIDYKQLWTDKGWM